MPYPKVDYERRAAAIRRHALAIHRGDKPQDIRILCPVRAGGAHCQWVAGHYGGCVLGRYSRQASL